MVRGNSGSIATVSWEPNRVDALVMDTGNQETYHTSFSPSTSWVNENHVPVATGATGDPIVVSTGVGVLGVFYRDANGGLHQLHYPGCTDYLLATNKVR